MLFIKVNHVPQDHVRFTVEVRRTLGLKYHLFCTFYLEVRAPPHQEYPQNLGAARKCSQTSLPLPMPIVFPNCFKKPTIILVPRKNKIACLNDYHPMALISIIIKCSERLAMAHTISNLPCSLDPLQCLLLHQIHGGCHLPGLALILEHADNKDNCVRVLFIDYSFTLYTIILILDFLFCR